MSRARDLPRTTMQINGQEMAVVDSGQGPPVLLLHGFPDSADVWRHLVPALVEAGFRAVAPDLRGMGDSGAPPEKEAYSNQHFFGDITGLIDELSLGQVDLIAHDIGAGFAWAVAGLMPDRVRRLAVFSVGHPASYWIEGLPQRERSWYMWFVRHEGFADEAFRKEDWRLFREWAAGAPDLERYLEDLSRPGRLEAALHWYRGRQSLEWLIEGAPTLPAVSCPTLGLWGAHDPYCGEAQMLASADRVSGPWRYERIEAAGHWIPLDAPDQVNDLVLQFLKDGD